MGTPDKTQISGQGERASERLCRAAPLLIVLFPFVFSACVPHRVSLAPEYFADRKPIYVTAGFSVHAPPGHWLIDSAFAARHLESTLCYPADILDAQDEIASYFLFALGTYREFKQLVRKPIATLTFYQVAKIGWEFEGDRMDANSCVRISAFTLGVSLTDESDSSIQHAFEPILRAMPLGAFPRFSRAFLQPWVIGDRKFYIVRMVNAKSEVVNDYGRLILFVSGDRLFTIFFSDGNVKPTDAAWTVVTSIQPAGR
jgi:hypothetical protein